LTLIFSPGNEMNSSKKGVVSLLCAVALTQSFSALAQSAPAKVPTGSFAVVNAVPLPNALLEQVLKNNAAQGVKDSPELRSVVRRELAGRAALSQEAMKLGLDKQEGSLAQMELLKQNFLAEMLITDYLTKNPVSDAALRADYERQVAVLKDAKEYKIRDIVLPDEAAAKAALANVRKGEAFEKVAKEKSIDPSKSQGGDLGWLLSEQINPLIANVVVNLSKGSVSAAPIQVQNAWHIIKVDDIRNFVAPKIEDAEGQIRQALQMKLRNEFVNQIISTAKVQLAD
jgi:peptidyl-prolyl cis-trans isomerase C